MKNNNTLSGSALGTGILAISILATLPAMAQKMNPGLWEATSSIHLNGIPLPDSKDEECISKETTQNLKSQLSAELQKKGCKIEKWDLKKQNLMAKVSCDKDDLKANGELKGTVTPKSYKLSGDAEGSFKGIPSVAKLELTGQWKGDCKK